MSLQYYVSAVGQPVFCNMLYDFNLRSGRASKGRDENEFLISQHLYILARLGDVYKELKQNEKALKQYEKALGMSQFLKNTDNRPESICVACVLKNISEVLIELKDYPKAVSYSKELLNYVNKISTSNRLGVYEIRRDAIQNIAFAYQKAGNVIKRVFEKSGRVA